MRTSNILSLLIVMGAATAFAKAPNIVFIFTDDHAVRAISAYHDAARSSSDHASGPRLNHTPNLDRLAKEGVLFRNSFVTNSICGPSRAVILTGKHSHINGFRKNDDNFDGSQPTFIKALGAAGYQTAVIGKWHLKSNPEGFDHWDILPGQGHYYNPDFVNKSGKYNVKGYVTDVVTDKALDWIQQRDKSRPFMVMIQQKAPHREWMPPLKYLSLYDDVTFPEPSNLFDDYATRGSAARNQDMSIEKTMNLAGDNKVWEPVQNKAKNHLWKYNVGRMTPDEQKKWNAAYGPKNAAFLKAKLTGRDLVRWKYQRYLKDYLRCIASVDENVGRVLDHLDEQGLAENTLVVYSSDQGFYLGEHGWFDKRFMYEESMRTPLMMRWPKKIKPGTVRDELVQNLDFAETFLDAAGVGIPPEMQGRSLVPLFGSATPDWRNALYYHYYEGAKSWHRVAEHDGIRTDRYKLISFYGTKEWELFDLKNDPHEMKNLAGNPEYASLRKSMAQKLAAIRKRYDVPSPKNSN